MNKSVVVVGGGLAGLTSALFLSEQGCDVTIVDSHALGSGAARGNAGYVCTSLVAPLPGPGQFSAALKGLRDPTRALRVKPQAIPGMARWFVGFARASNARQFERGRAALATLNQTNAATFQRLRNLGVEFELGKELLIPFHDVSAAHHFHADLMTMTNFGVEPVGEMLDGPQIRRLTPALTDHVQAGFLVPGDRSLDPRKFVDSLIEVALRRGVIAHEHTTVTSIDSAARRITALQTTAGRLDADEFVITAGAGTRALAKLFGLRLTVVPGQGYNVALPYDAGMDRPVIFEEVHAVATPFVDRIRLGGTMEFGGDKPSFDQRRVDAIISSLRRFIDLDWDKCYDTWAGSRPISPDGLPYLGRPKKWSNVVVAAGHGMYGLTLAPPTAAIVADLVTADGTSANLTAFDPDR